MSPFKDPLRDLCQPSVDLLYAKCVAWFKRKGIAGKVHFPDHDDLIFAETSKEPVNVVFFGSFLRRLLESSLWSRKTYRIWVLCEATRDVLTQLLGFSTEQIGVIPRYELFAPGKAQRDFPRTGEPFTLVFSGRISPTKNIELLLKTASFLQTEQKQPVEIAIFGRFDNETHMDRLNSMEIDQCGDYRKYIQGCIAECDWVTPPRLIHDCGPDEWYRQDLRNPVFVSLSTLVTEDYGVALAQAQAQGWPCLLSEWGAHRDVRGPGVRKLPLSLIGLHDGQELATLKARQLAGYIQELVDEPRKRRPAQRFPKETQVSLPALVDIHEVDLIRRGLVDQMGESAHLLCRSDLVRLTEVGSGEIFFSRYRHFFAGTVPSSDCAILINNLHVSENPLLKHVSRICGLLLEEAISQGVKVSFFSAQDINQMDTLSQVLHSEKVVFPFFTEELLPSVLFLLNAVSTEVPLTVFAYAPPGESGRGVRVALKKLRSAMRGTDHLHEFSSPSSLRRSVESEFTSDAKPGLRTRVARDVSLSRVVEEARK